MGVQILPSPPIKMNLTKKEIEKKERIKEIKLALAQSTDPDFKLLEMHCCSKWGVSLRLAKEMIKVAEFELSNA